MASSPSNRKSLSYEPEKLTSLGKTDVDQDVFSFLWTINNYSTMIKLGAVESPVFRGGPKNNYGWQLEISRNEEDEAFISLDLELTDSRNGEARNEDRVVKANFQFAILNADGRLVNEHGGLGSPINEFKKPNKTWGYRKFYKSTDLLNPQSNFLVDGALKILCKIWIFGETMQTLRHGPGANSNRSHEERVRVSKDGLANDLGKMFRESIGTDVTISCKEANFKAHQLILSARSPVFAAMFNADMLESRVSCVQISDFEDDVVKGMLEHIYTGETECMDERARELLRIAEKYDLKGLKAQCECELGDKLNLENVGDILVLAETNNASDLKSRATNFINWNKDNLLESKSFQDAVKRADAGTLADTLFSLKQNLPMT